MTRARWAILVAGLYALAGCGNDPSGSGGVNDVVWSTGSRDGTTHGNGGAGGGTARVAMELRVRSQRATRVDVYVYAAPTGEPERLVRTLEHAEGTDVWTASISAEELTAAGVEGTPYYGLRAWGPNWPYDAAWIPGSEVGFVADVDADGNRFNPNKLLIDPYTRELSHDPTTPEMLDASVYSTGPADRARDSGPVAPKSIWLAPDAFAPVSGERPARPLSDDTIYEVHVRGFTKHDPMVDPACRGTYRGAAQKAAYLAGLGVTAIELLPIHETPNSTNDVEMSTSGDNYWGYSTLGFFAPDRRYACDQSPGGPTREFREMVAAMHAQGIKVFLDVVYNHTWEGGVGNPDVARIHSLRGLDNAGYYELDADPQLYADNTGVGANTNAKNGMLRDLVLDSLAYWHGEMGVDGFRFDLASVLANGCERDCFSFEPDDPGGILSRAVVELPARPLEGGPGVDLIVEPWAIGQGTYQIGNYPDGFSEWNGIYRDTLRRHQNRLEVDAVTPRQLVYKIVGSPDLFADDGRSPRASVNFIVAHDGFTLRDLYACNEMDNDQPWPYGPSDGGENNNLSWDQGADAARQRQAWRTGLALLLLSAGAPMITGGDELYRTQHCNNNAYNLDASTNWLDWALASTEPALTTFAAELLRFRRAHVALRPIDWPRPEDPDGNGLGGWVFLTDQGVSTSEAYLDDPGNRFLGWRVDGEAAGDDARSILVLYNGHTEAIVATLPAAATNHVWSLVLDTGASSGVVNNIHAPGDEPVHAAPTYVVEPRSVVVLVEQPAR